MQVLLLVIWPHHRFNDWLIINGVRQIYLSTFNGDRDGFELEEKVPYHEFDCNFISGVPTFHLVHLLFFELISCNLSLFIHPIEIVSRCTLEERRNIQKKKRAGSAKWSQIGLKLCKKGASWIVLFLRPNNTKRHQMWKLDPIFILAGKTRSEN